MSLTTNLWIKPEPFTYGALPVAPHSRLSPHNIKKIVNYAKSKGRLGFPKLSYTVWKHIACNKLQLKEPHAWMYFLTYDLVSSGAKSSQRIEWDENLALCKSQQEIDQLRNLVAASTFEFVLFLYIQQLHKISLRASLVKSADEWPLRARSPEPESRNIQTGAGAKSIDEHAHMTFVLNNLNELMELLVEPDVANVKSSQGDLILSSEAVEALGFLITGSTDKNKTVKSLRDITLLPENQSKCGLLKNNHYSFRVLQSWLRENISQNPFGISKCIEIGRRLNWTIHNKDSRPDLKHGKIATNALFIPKEDVSKNKVIIMSQVCGQTVAKSSTTLEKSSVTLHRCHNSFIYLLSPMRSVNIGKCRRSVIFLGAVETTVHINHCDHLTIVAVCRRISISSSLSCTLHVLTPTTPLILGGNEDITLAPYHTYYPSLEKHMYSAGLSSKLNVWTEPLCIGFDHQEDAPVWKLMDPQDFYLSTIPFKMEGITECIPCEIPETYLAAVTKREQSISAWQKYVKEAPISKEQKKQFQALVESRFQEWLHETGNRRELDGLILPTESSLSK